MANRRQLKIGVRVRIADGSGLDSRKIATVAHPGSVTDGYTMHLIRDSRWIAVLVDGSRDITAMPANRLTIIE